MRDPVVGVDVEGADQVLEACATELELEHVDVGAAVPLNLKSKLCVKSKGRKYFWRASR